MRLRTSSASIIDASAEEGLHRLQARKPALVASLGDAKNRTFRRNGRRDPHEGRQNTPVVETAYTNRPSCRLSLAVTADQASAGDSDAEEWACCMTTKVEPVAPTRTPYLALNPTVRRSPSV
jgi:hypothetical protein